MYYMQDGLRMPDVPKDVHELAAKIGIELK
jgi:hypothetical protein